MGFVFQKKCKVCLLVNQDAELWWSIHKKILEDGASILSVQGWLRDEEIPRRNMERPDEMKLAPISYASLQNHFTKKRHVPSMQAAREACSDGWKKDLEREAGNSDVVTSYSLRQSLADVGEEVHDLIRMKQLIYATERRLHAYNNKLTAKEKSGEEVASLEEIATFQKLIKELLTLKKEATKVELQSTVAGTAVREGVSLLIEETVKTLSTTTDELHALLTRELPGSKLPDQVRNTIRMQVGEKMKSSLAPILETVQKRYGIK